MGRQEREDNNRFIEERKQQWHEELRERLEIAAGGFGNINERLAAQEAEADRMEREESSREKQARMDHINSFRKMTAEKNKEAADTLRETTERGMHSALSNSHRRKYLDAEDKRAGSRSAQELFAERERERKAKTAEAKARVLAIRENAMRAREQLANRRRKEKEMFDQTQGELKRAGKERMDKIYFGRKGMRGQVFHNRYVSRDLALGYQKSAFKKLFAMDDVSDQQIDDANAELLEKIENVVQRTDDCIDDDAAGEARIVAAKLSRERKAAEAARIAQANAELH